MTKRPINPQFGPALRSLRRARGLAQEEFDQVSSRTYISALERGIKQPTLSKLTQLAGVLRVHPLTLVVLAFVGPKSADGARQLFDRVTKELDMLLPESK